MLGQFLKLKKRNEALYSIQKKKEIVTWKKKLNEIYLVNTVFCRNMANSFMPLHLF